MYHLIHLHKAEYFSNQSIKEIKVICMTNKFINSISQKNRFQDHEF